MSTVAGTGVSGFTGDAGPAAAAQLAIPVAVVGTPDGGYLIADQANNRIRRVTPDGTITTIAGSGTGAGYSGDGGPATSAKLDAPSGVAQLADGTVLIADINNNAIRRVAPDGTISTVVGNGAAAFGGDGGPASAAKIRFPYDIAPLPGGGYLIVDQDNDRIRKVDAGGTITTVAGSGAIGAGGDGGPATLAQLNDPSGVIVMPDGGFLIADTNNSRIRRVAPDGTISTFAGTTAGFGGDGGPATAAKLNGPIHLALLPDGGVVIADWHNNRIRKVDAAGTITTIAGDGTAASGGDGGPASATQVDGPFGVGVATDGDVLIADTFVHRIRRADFGDPAPAQKRGPTAQFSVSSGPACVGTPVTFDAAASTAGTGGPIVDYRFTYANQVAGKAAALQTAIAKIDAAKAQAQFAWDRAMNGAQQSLAAGIFSGLGGAKSAAAGVGPVSQVPIPSFVRDPAQVTLTVTDASGATSSTQQTVQFAQSTSTAPRAPCGDAAQIDKQKAIGASIGGIGLSATALAAGLGCPAAAKLGCSGAVIAAAPSSKIAEAIAGYLQQLPTAKAKVLDAQQRLADAAAADAAEAAAGVRAAKEHVAAVKDAIKKILDIYGELGRSVRSASVSSITGKRKTTRPKAATLGAVSFQLAAGKNGTLQVPLSKSARNIVRRHGYLVVRQLVVSVAPSGKQTTKAKTIVLKRTRVKKAG